MQSASAPCPEGGHHTHHREVVSATGAGSAGAADDALGQLAKRRVLTLALAFALALALALALAFAFAFAADGVVAGGAEAADEANGDDAGEDDTAGAGGCAGWGQWA